MSHYKAEMHQIRFRLGSSQRSPRPSSWIKGVLLLKGGKGGKEREEEGDKGEGGREGERRGGEGWNISRMVVSRPWQHYK